MDSKFYYEKFSEITKKLGQVLRLKRKLEERREQYMTLLRSPDPPKGNVLNSLLEIYKKELRIISYCKKGLLNANSLLEEVEHQIFASSFYSRIRDSIKSKLPFVSKSEKQSLELLFRLMFLELRKQMMYLNERIEIIKDLVELQSRITSEIGSEINAGISTIEIANSRKFRELEYYHNEELRIITNIEKKSRRVKIMEITNNINSIISKYPKLATAQGMLIAIPTVATFTTAGSYFLGMEFFPILYFIGQFLKYGPTIAVLLIQATHKKLIS